MSGQVVVATPRCGPPTWLYVDSLRMLQAPAPGYRYVFNPKVVSTDVARNWLARQVLEAPELRGCEWVLWLDADAEVHPGTLERLLSWGQPVVGALCFTTGAPVTPTVFRGKAEGDGVQIRVHEVYEWVVAHPDLHTHRAALVTPRPDAGEALFEVDFTGLHCLLMHRSVLEAVEFPWFVATADQANREDRFFCEKVRAAGLKVFVDLSMTTGHVIGDRRSMGALDFCAWYAISDFAEEEYG